MDFNQLPSAQLEALKLLLNNEDLRNVIFSQNASISAPNKPSKAPEYSVDHEYHRSARSSQTSSIPDPDSPPYNPKIEQCHASPCKVTKKKNKGPQPNQWTKGDSQTSAGTKKSTKLMIKPLSRQKQAIKKPTVFRNELHNLDMGVGMNMDMNMNRGATHFHRPAKVARVARVARRRFVIGLDYGTTFTSVSYYAMNEGEEDPIVFPAQVGIIRNWPHDSMHGVNMQVPTESWYSSIPRVRQPTRGQFDDGEDAEVEIEELLRAGTSRSQTSLMPFGSTLDNEQSSQFLWGYEVPYQRYREYSSRDPNRHIERPKLMLVSSKHTAADRQKLRPRINHLISKGIIRKFAKRDVLDCRDVQDIITDFMVPVLEHTQDQLIRLEGFDQNTCSVSFALTVPTIWSAKSSRVLQYALEDAIRITGFGSLGHDSVDNLFVVSEPEAAATYLLGNNRDMMAGETFVVMDCGGGTVDGSTYTVANSYPLRLDQEVILPTGDNCGASYLNENFEALMMNRLADEHYLEDNGDTLESIVKSLIPNFEDYDKRNKDISKSPTSRVRIPGLIGDKRRGLRGPSAKRFDDNFLLLYPEDYNLIFKPLLRRTCDVLKMQLDAARAKGKYVRKVFLIGGFGAAPSLRSYLKTFLGKYAASNRNFHSIELILSDEQACVTAVSSGAVLRAMNLKNGPIREAHSNYGVLRIQPFQPAVVRGHREMQPKIDELDGEAYVTVIHYFMLKGEVIEPVHEFPPLQCTHTFTPETPELQCEEVIYVNDNDTKSNYGLSHAVNQGAQVVGKIATDMTFLKSELVPVIPPMDAEGNCLKGQIHYEVKYDLVVIVEGRNLRYEARYPSSAAGKGKALETGQISIASAFLPGTG